MMVMPNNIAKLPPLIKSKGATYAGNAKSNNHSMCLYKLTAESCSGVQK